MVNINSVYKHKFVKGLSFKDIPSLAQQQYLEESDLNNIVDHNMRYKDPAFITRLQLQGKVSQAQPIYGDFSDVGDYMQSLEVIKTANEQFTALPAKVRDRFHNNPAEMLAFCNDSANYDEGVELGLYQKPVENVVNSDQKPVENVVNSDLNGDTAGLNPVPEPVSGTSAQ